MIALLIDQGLPRSALCTGALFNHRDTEDTERKIWSLPFSHSPSLPFSSVLSVTPWFLYEQYHISRGGMP